MGNCISSKEDVTILDYIHSRDDFKIFLKPRDTF